MGTNKVPYRLCIACRESKPKKELIRIVKTDSGFAIDKTGKLNGRGSYICNNESCINNLIKHKVLNKVFKSNINADVYENLKEQFFGDK